MTIKKAVQKLIDRADELILAIEGVDDQFEPEIERLTSAITKVENMLQAGVL